MSLLSPTIDRLHCLVDEDADHNMLQDLQLAAELGKTLLERNKELENTIRSQQDKIEEQAHEIEYMKKQTTALREVNDSRLKIYEQLEVSIQDLERANHLLVVDNANDKKLLKTQSMTIENLEIRCEDIQKKFDDFKCKYQLLVKQQTTNEEVQEKVLWKSTTDGSINQKATSITTKSTSNATGNAQEHVNSTNNDEEVTSLLKQLSEVRSQRTREQKKISDLESQLSSLVRENNNLEEQLNVWQNKAQDVKNLQDELSTLEEVRQGHLCGRCLRGINMRSHEELTLMMDRNGDDIPEDDDDISLPGTFMDGVNGYSNCLVQDINNKMGIMDQIQDSYKMIFTDDKGHNSHSKTTAQNTCLSLQEELRMSGEFNNFQNATTTTTIIESKEKSAKIKKSGKKFSSTPTDFSEAETLSSGFSDETINKSTQTDGRPGSLLCSIADGDNCKLSIYDDNSTFESRFNHTPEYRQIFSEIVSALKRAAEAKEESEKSPQNNISDISNISSNYSFGTDGVGSEETDDTQSVMSSTICSVVSEPIIKLIPPHFSNKERHHKVEAEKTSETPSRPLHYKRQPLDYLSIQTRKKSAKKNSPKKSFNVEPHSTPDVIPTTNPKFTNAKSNSGSKRRFRPLTNTDLESGVWNGHTTHFYSSKKKDRRPTNSHPRTSQSNSSNQSNSSFEYKDYKPSVASQEIAKLKKLDMSYAEVLRMPNKPKGTNMRRSS
ncbi:cerebellar degeneration-related protein 2 isoform X2 [Leptopilina heterotoma]|uniref:cerebellar degeneration-related protein 2 isoform X2 n=1 Tax=Leptopilina heterotoma TaxID=63436 RepID=UPI001CA8D314|nr:cerebellar degeneration-related protein 2 isoform X2 [Leptopilina heterotoma]